MVDKPLIWKESLPGPRFTEMQSKISMWRWILAVTPSETSLLIIAPSFGTYSMGPGWCRLWGWCTVRSEASQLRKAVGQCSLWLARLRTKDGTRTCKDAVPVCASRSHQISAPIAQNLLPSLNIQEFPSWPSVSNEAFGNPCHCWNSAPEHWSLSLDGHCTPDMAKGPSVKLYQLWSCLPRVFPV